MYKIRTHVKTTLADMTTPVSLYLKVRDLYPRAILLESSDYHGGQDNYSFICLEPVAGIIVEHDRIRLQYPGQQESQLPLGGNVSLLEEFISSFQPAEINADTRLNGFFGYMSYDAAALFEKVPGARSEDTTYRIPLIRYHIYRYIIAINHFRNTVRILENRFDDGENTLETIESILVNRNIATFDFKPAGPVSSNLTDEEYKELVKAGKKHCHLGDVYQIVMSRRFEQKFTGDEFNVYRRLRSINPSPYLFYFDFGGYRIFGSSPEAHLIVRNRKASICPIAGTFRRTGDDERDRQLAEQLAKDPKESAEHVMLVDLARNDLSRNAFDVNVETFKEIQFFSHVLHMVSTVSGTLPEDFNLFKLMGDTFPAGTLSGAPKIRAMELIHQYESTNRGFYGGCIGQIGFDRSLNQAIMIRSFLSIGNQLVFQAGAGIVSESVEESELNEVNNKLGALREAIRQA
jgi:anthranilate synthase component 1